MMKALILRLSGAVTLVWAASLGCSTTTDNCDATSTCVSPGGGSGGTTAGPGGATAGTGGGGHADTATAGTSGGGAGAAGMTSQAGASGASPCDGACTGTKPVCNPATNSCVECVGKTDCVDPTPACDTATNVCVECTDSPDCKDSAKPLCDKAAKKCVACLQQSDCNTAAASKCDAGTCKPCTADADCSGIAGKGVCDAGTCVQCTGKKFAACGLDTGVPLVCDSLKRTCTTSKQHTAGLCQTCTTDAQCKAGLNCVLEKFGTPSKDVGYFCQWKQGDTANGAPADCTVGGQPYFGVQKSAASIDGAVSDICVLRKSTCPARSEFGGKDCKVSGTPDDSVCGFSPPKDAKCEQVGASTSYRCSMACLSDDDCPGTVCDTGSSPSYCLF